jgi:hypothetical protein
MLYREAQRGFRTIKNPAGLVIPVNVFDEQFFPDKARKIEWLDLRDFWIVGEGFVKTERYVQFQDRLRDWSLQVARIIRRAPSWEKAWLTGAWLDVPDEELRPKPSRNFRFVGLE